MNERIKKLRRQSVEAIPSISVERALLLTRFYQSDEARELSAPLKRARALKYILDHKHICINEDELIVGERGPAPKATSTYPEVCLHSVEDLDILHNRPKVAFRVDDEVKRIYRETVIPYWHGKSLRDKIMALMSPQWQQAYHSGLFTEFQEQRAPGHTVLDDKIYRKGMADFMGDIDFQLAHLDFLTDPSALDRYEALQSMKIAAQAIVDYSHRHAMALEQLAADEASLPRRNELVQMAQICRKVPLNKPTTFHEALQYYWFVHLGVITEVNPWDSFNPGRLDQHLLPFYEQDLRDGRLTEDKTKELLMCFWIKFNNHPAPPKMGVTAKESNTYTDFALINLGGIDVDGADAVNPLTYLMLDVIEELRLLQPSSMVQISNKNPDRYIHRVLDITKTGYGQPSFFNADAIVQELLVQGKSLADARCGGASGCVETGAFGKEAYWLTGYFNLPKILELTLYNGVDPRTGMQIGLSTGDVNEFVDFKAFLDAFATQVKYFADMKIEGNNKIEAVIGRNLPVPFLSLLIDDCIVNGKDYNAGGARYNTSYIQGVGMGTVTDALTAIREHVYEKKDISFSNLIKALKHDFVGFDSLRLRLLYETAKYGNDDDFADQQAANLFNIYFDVINGRPTSRGGVHRINLLPTTCHIYFGEVLGAMPDGRKAGEPVSEGISPVQGADRQGPTAVVNTMSKLDHLRTGGTLLNMKFTPSFFKGEKSKQQMTALIRSYFYRDGHHIQFNVVDAQTLRQAQANPERFADLIVRVAGYSDYFNDLTPQLQEEIIKRTEHDFNIN